MRKNYFPAISIFLFAAFIFCSGGLTAQHKYKRKKHKAKHYRSPTAMHYSSRSGGGDFYQDDWIVYGQASINNPLKSNLKPSFGVSAEYFFADNWSLRGGMNFSQNYGRFTTAPIGVGLTKLLFNADWGAGCGNSDGLFYVLLGTVASLGINDGISYNIPVGNSFHISPYFGTCQYQYKPQKWLTCSMGVNFKFNPGDLLVVELGTEYNRTFLFADSREAFRVNFSVGLKLY